jgi:hypothetical protein
MLTGKNQQGGILLSSSTSTELCVWHTCAKMIIQACMAVAYCHSMFSRWFHGCPRTTPTSAGVT